MASDASPIRRKGGKWAGATIAQPRQLDWLAGERVAPARPAVHRGRIPLAWQLLRAPRRASPRYSRSRIDRRYQKLSRGHGGRATQLWRPERGSVPRRRELAGQLRLDLLGAGIVDLAGAGRRVSAAAVGEADLA